MFKVGDKIVVKIPNGYSIGDTVITSKGYSDVIMDSDFYYNGCCGTIIKYEGKGVYTVKFENGSKWSPLDVCMVLDKRKSFNTLLLD